MKALFVTAAVLFLAAPAQANVCTDRAHARHHTRISQARQEYVSRRNSCQTLPVPDRVVQCIAAAQQTFDHKSQNSREQRARDLRACSSET